MILRDCMVQRLRKGRQYGKGGYCQCAVRIPVMNIGMIGMVFANIHKLI